MNHCPDKMAESFFQLYKDMTMTSKEQARQKQLDFLESMKVFEEMHEYELPAATHVVSGRLVNTMKTPIMWGSTCTAKKVMKKPTTMKDALQVQQRHKASFYFWPSCFDKRDQGHESLVADYTQAFLNAEVQEDEQLYAQPPEGWNPKILTDGRRVVWRVRKAMLGLRTSPKRW